MGYELFWGETHANIHTRHLEAIDEILSTASSHLDFLAMAYYPYRYRDVRGFSYEDWIEEDQVDSEWKTICEATKRHNSPGRFVVFPGYEWQGDGTWGDHNVFHLYDDPPLARVDTLPELYSWIRDRGLEALTIPHHTAYMVGIRGKNWDLLNDGLGNPKNTKSLLLAHRTPPAMALGVRSDAEAAVRAGIKHIQFAVRPEQDAVAIDEYLRSLKPLPSPYLQAGRLSQGAKRGRKIFKKAECATCHPAPLYTDRGKYDVGTGKLGEKGKAFDTPTLVEVWRTAPYLHDGRAATIREVLTKYNPADRHGKTSGLTDAQLDDLTEFILSL